MRQPERRARKTLFLILLLTATFAFGQEEESEEEDQPYGDVPEACYVILCLAAWAFGGDSISECEPYFDPYYGIEVIVRGTFDPRRTKKERKKYLKGCQSSDNKTRDQYNNSDRASYNPSDFFHPDGTNLTLRELYMLRREYGDEILEHLVQRPR